MRQILRLWSEGSEAMTHSGYAGKILRVDLTEGRLWTEPTKKYSNDWIGGRGINDWILFNELRPETGPLDPENMLLFGVGSLVGTLSPFCCRVSVDTKNVFNGGVGSANCGGHFGAEMKYAGYDNLVITGRSPEPVYLWLNDGEAELRDAEKLWGTTTWDTERSIRQMHGDNEVRVIGIGQAGENLVKSACIMSDRAKAAGGSGVGAVMGSKNLKAVAARGSQPISVAHPERFIDAVDEVRAKIETFPKAKLYREDGYYGVESYYGSPAWEAGFRPVRNGQDDYWDPEKIKRVAGDTIKPYRKKILACYGCPVGCMPWMKIPDGPYEVEGEGWWNNSSNSFCTRVDVDNPEAAIKAHLRTNQLGLDGDNASVVIAWAFEAYEKGLLTVKDTDGLELTWGNHDAMLTLIDKLAYREGFGDFLADGVKAAAEKLGGGSEDYALHIRGQDAVDGIRISKGWGFGVVTSQAHGRHLRGAVHSFSPDKFLSWDDVPYNVHMQEQFKAILDSTGTCLYNNGLLSWETRIEPSSSRYIVELNVALTGMDYGVDGYMKIGRRIHNLEKAFNTLHCGFTRKDDYPPKRYWEEPVKSGPYKGEHLDHETWDRMLEQYYELHGWDPETGLQTREGLEELGLGSVADKLRAAGLVS
ncbi:MAG: aldehyde ferredoxin oxidoreductase family protein [Candidatus Bathyarchaeota archaeon]|nr:aldehyde ferredoxin oxidoreductase family protein [Candidatus Bathyarchaeota archaeon]